jgi:hypothetical protein
MKKIIMLLIKFIDNYDKMTPEEREVIMGTVKEYALPKVIGIQNIKNYMEEL